MPDKAPVRGTVKADRLQQFIDQLAALVGEAKIHFSDDGLFASAVDPANVAMFNDVKLGPDALESLDAPGAVTLGVDLQRVDDCLASASGDDLVHFETDMETRHLSLEYRGISHSIALIDPDAIRQEPDDPDFVLPNHATMSAGLFTEALENCEITADHCHLAAGDDGDQLRIYSRGDTDETEITVGPEQTASQTITEAGIESLFSLDYLSDIMGPVPDDAALELRWGDEYPCIGEYSAFDEAFYVRWMCAPRIQSD